MKTQIAICMALSLLLLAGCAGTSVRDARPDSGPLAIHTPKALAKEDPDVKRYYGDPTELITSFENAARIARCKEAPTTGELRHYMNLGFTLSEVYCGVYINQITNAYNHQRFARSTTSDVGGLAALGLGLLKNSAQVVSLTAGGFSFADNVFRNYSTSYMPPDNIRKNFDVLYRARAKLLVEMGKAELNNVAQAESRINFYASTCTMAWMERLISSVTENATDQQIQAVINASSLVPSPAGNAPGGVSESPTPPPPPVP